MTDAIDRVTAAKDYAIRMLHQSSLDGEAHADLTRAARELVQAIGEDDVDGTAVELHTAMQAALFDLRQVVGEVTIDLVTEKFRAVTPPYLALLIFDDETPAQPPAVADSTAATVDYTAVATAARLGIAVELRDLLVETMARTPHGAHSEDLPGLVTALAAVLGEARSVLADVVGNTLYDLSESTVPDSKTGIREVFTGHLPEHLRDTLGYPQQ